MGLVDALSKEDRVEVKFNDFYTLVKGCTERDMMKNAIMCDVPHRHIREMVNGKKEDEASDIKEVNKKKQTETKISGI